MTHYEAKIANLASMDKLNSIQTGYKDMKYNLERELELLQEHIKEVQDKGGELGKRITNLERANIDPYPAMSIPMAFNPPVLAQQSSTNLPSTFAGG